MRNLTTSLEHLEYLTELENLCSHSTKVAAENPTFLRDY